MTKHDEVRKVKAWAIIYRNKYIGTVDSTPKYQFYFSDLKGRGYDMSKCKVVPCEITYQP